MTRKPVFSFDNQASTGLEFVPVENMILIEDSDGVGTPKLIYLSDRTGIDNTTTVDTLLTTLTAQWHEVGGAGGGNTKTDFITSTPDEDTFTVGYAIGTVSVYVEGVKINSDSYDAANGTSVILDNPVDTGTWIQVVSGSEAAVSPSASTDGDNTYSGSNIFDGDTTFNGAVDFAGTPVTDFVTSDITETGTDKVNNIVSCTQAEYDALTPVATTFYIIVG